MLIRWHVEGSPHYPSMDRDQTIAYDLFLTFASAAVYTALILRPTLLVSEIDSFLPAKSASRYISDVGAFGLKPLFITGCCVTTVFLDLGFLSDRYLRHTGRLAPNTSTAQKVLSIIAIVFALAGSAGLILLSIFDTYHHDRLHDGFLLLFIAGFILSAIFICAEYQRLGIHYRNHRVLRISFWIKLVFILVEVAVAIAFAVTMFSSAQNTAGVLEWVIAFIFTFYILSFTIDLLPGVKTRHHTPQGFEDRAEMALEGAGTAAFGRSAGLNGHGRAANRRKEGENERSWKMRLLGKNF